MLYQQPFPLHTLTVAKCYIIHIHLVWSVERVCWDYGHRSEAMFWRQATILHEAMHSHTLLKVSNWYYAPKERAHGYRHWDENKKACIGHHSKWALYFFCWKSRLWHRKERTLIFLEKNIHTRKNKQESQSTVNYGYLPRALTSFIQGHKDKKNNEQFSSNRKRQNYHPAIGIGYPLGVPHGIPFPNSVHKWTSAM